MSREDLTNQYGARTEAEEQEAVITWARMSAGTHPELSLLFHIPNGGSRRPSEAAHLKRLGVRPGVPDLFLPVARGPWHGLFIEMKRADKSTTSKDQIAWIRELTRQGYMARVCLGFEQARITLEDYLG